MITDVLYEKTIASPVGKLRLIASDKGLRAVMFEGARNKRFAADEKIEESDTHPMLLRAEKQLAEYFAGKRADFDVKLDIKGTVFQINAWRQLQKIPYGETISYGEQASGLGDKNKARAVGMANNRNPVCIIIPCHRVIGASGALVGFGGGLKTKQYLLDLEKRFSAKKAA